MSGEAAGSPSSEIDEEENRKLIGEDHVVLGPQSAAQESYSKTLESMGNRISTIQEKANSNSEQIEQMKENLKEVRDKLESDSNQESQERELPKDVYSLLYFENHALLDLGFEEWKVFAFVMAVFFSQVAMLSFIIVNLFDYDKKNLPPFNPPADVTWVVRVSQYLAIMIAVWTQEDLTECIDLFLSREKWLIVSAVLKFSIGGLGLFVSVVIVIQSDKIVDLFANFAAMAFISQFDNALFLLAENGFILPSLRGRVECASKQFVPNAEENNRGTRSKKYVFLLGMIAVLLVPLIYIHARQQRGAYLPYSIDVYVGEDSNDLFATSFNGEYIFGDGGRNRHGRPVYYEKDCFEGCKKKHSGDEAKGQLESCINACNQVTYCETKRWALPSCNETKTIAQSERTDSFDISTVSEWRVWHWSEIEAFSGALAPIPSFSVTSNRCQMDTDCGGADDRVFCDTSNECVCYEHLGARCQARAPCGTLEIQIGKSFPDYSQSFMLLRNVAEDAATLFKGRPIYYSKKTNMEYFEIIIFIGSRWILMGSQELELHNIGEAINGDINMLARAIENNEIILDRGVWKGDYISQETFNYSPAGLSWNRWIHDYMSNEKQENGLFGKVESVKSFLLCSVCSWWVDSYGFWDTCNGNGVCRHYLNNLTDRWTEDPCSCYNGWYGSQCNVPSVGELQLQLAFEYGNSSKCFETSTFDPIPFGWMVNETFTLDLIPPIRFADGDNEVGIRMTKNATHLEVYQSSCDGKKVGDALKSVKLPCPDCNNYTTFVLDHHDDLFEMNSTGVKGLSPKKHEYCADETFSSTVPDIFITYASENISCSDFEQEEDPKLHNLVRMLVTIKFDSVTESPFKN